MKQAEKEKRKLFFFLGEEKGVVISEALAYTNNTPQGGG
jgi:hypothetical protein